MLRTPLRLLSRLLQSVAILVALSVVLFGVLTAMPGDPVEQMISQNPRVRPEDVQRLRRQRGLDRHWLVQYWRWAVGYAAPLSPPRPGREDAKLVVDGEAPARFDLAAGLFDPDVRLDGGALTDLEVDAGLMPNKAFDREQRLSRCLSAVPDGGARLDRALAERVGGWVGTLPPLTADTAEAAPGSSQPSPSNQHGDGRL